MQLLLVVDVWRRGSLRKHLAGITAPEKEPRRRREAGGGDDGSVDGSGDGGRQEAGITAPSLDPSPRKGMAAVDPSPASHGAAGSLAPAAAVARSPATAASGGRKRVGLGLGRSWTRRAL